MKKTNALRFLEANNIKFETITYDAQDGKIDGVSVAHKIGLPAHQVYKTIVVQGAKANYVLLIAVDKEINLKQFASAVGEKQVHMLPVQSLLGVTGYVRGGCSPIGMKKHFPTYIDESAQALDEIVVSAGAIGLQVKISLAHLAKVVDATFLPLQ